MCICVYMYMYLYTHSTCVYNYVIVLERMLGDNSSIIEVYFSYTIKRKHMPFFKLCIYLMKCKSIFSSLLGLYQEASQRVSVNEKPNKANKFQVTCPVEILFSTKYKQLKGKCNITRILRIGPRFYTPKGLLQR